MARIDFSNPTKLELARRVNFKCVYPGCDRVTHGPSRDRERIINLGHAAHDAAASSKGPRFNEKLTPEQIRAYENGAWLCASHAGLVDKDVKSFPPGTLARWQCDAELRASDAVYLAPINTYASALEVCSRLSRFLTEAKGISLVLYYHNRENTVIPRDVLVKMWSLVEKCSGHRWGPTNTLHSLHSHTVAIQNQAINCLSRIYNEVTDRALWMENEYRDAFYLRPGGSAFRPSFTQEQHDSVHHVYSCYERYNEHISDLRKYANGEGHNMFSTF